MVGLISLFVEMERTLWFFLDCSSVSYCLFVVLLSQSIRSHFSLEVCFSSYSRAARKLVKPETKLEMRVVFSDPAFIATFHSWGWRLDSSVTAPFVLATSVSSIRSIRR